MKVICVNDKNRPNCIPKENWCEQAEMYTVIEISRMARQSNVLGFKLAEIQPPSTSKYTRYLGSRFKPASDEDVKAYEEISKMFEFEPERDLVLV